MIKLRKTKYGYGIFINGRKIYRQEDTLYDHTTYAVIDVEVDYTFGSDDTDAEEWVEPYYDVLEGIFYYLDELNHLMFCWNTRNTEEDCFHIDEYRGDNDIVKKIKRRDYYNMKQDLIHKINREIERI